MAEFQNTKTEISKDEAEDFFVDGELLEIPVGEKLSAEEPTKISPRKNRVSIDGDKQNNDQKNYLQFIVLPLIFLTVALLGGVRLNAADRAFVFLTPALVCLIFATVLLVLFFRANLLKVEGWFSERFSTVQNIANACVLFALFAASTQIFNSLLPERGLPFWVFAFCFFWTLLNNLFSLYEPKRLIQSLGSLFGFAFVVKYLVLAYLTAPTSESWWRGILENPTQEAFTWLLDLPRFSAGTGYIQFFAVILFLLGLFLLAPVSGRHND